MCARVASTAVLADLGRADARAGGDLVPLHTAIATTPRAQPSVCPLIQATVRRLVALLRSSGASVGERRAALLMRGCRVPWTGTW